MPTVTARVGGRRIELPVEALPPSVELPKRNKFGAVPTEHDSPLNGRRRCPSKLQARIYAELDDLWKRGEVSAWLPEVTLCIGTADDGEPRRYRIDALVFGGVATVLGIEVKGRRSDARDAQTRRAAARDRYGWPILVVGDEGVLAALAAWERGEKG